MVSQWMKPGRETTSNIVDMWGYMLSKSNAVGPKGEAQVAKRENLPMH